MYTLALIGKESTWQPLVERSGWTLLGKTWTAPDDPAALKGWSALLDGHPDVVAIESAVGYHAELIIRSLQSGSHVIVYGPLCLTTAAAWQIIETARFCRRQVILLSPEGQCPELMPGDPWKLTLQLPYLPQDRQRFPFGGRLYQDAYPLLFSYGNALKHAVLVRRSPKVVAGLCAERNGWVELEMPDGAKGQLEWKESSITAVHAALETGGNKVEWELAATISDAAWDAAIATLEKTDNSAIDALAVAPFVSWMESIYKEERIS